MLNLFFLFVFSAAYLPALATDVEKYERILARLDTKQKQEYQKDDIEEIDQQLNHDNKEEKKLKKWYLTFEHENIPNLDGVWTFKKKSVKRINAPLIAPKSRANCNSRIPFSENILEKDVIVSARGIDHFVIRPLEIISESNHVNLTETNEADYQNFDFKGSVIPGEVSYGYVLKLVNNTENPAFARQVRFNGKVIFEKVSGRKIEGKGYEIEYSPECLGFVRDEIEFEMTKKDELAKEVDTDIDLEKEKEEGIVVRDKIKISSSEF